MRWIPHISPRERIKYLLSFRFQAEVAKISHASEILREVIISIELEAKYGYGYGTLAKMAGENKFSQRF